MMNVPEVDLDGAALGGVVGVILIIYLVILLLASVFGIVSYILSSIGTYTIANRRGIKHAWLAWIPVGSTWIMGCISDQYQQVAKGKKTNRRTIALFLMVATYVASMITTGVSIAQIVMLGMGEEEAAVGTGVLGSSLGSLLTGAVSLAYSVIYFFCLYDLYASAKPENAVLYIVLSILIGVVTPFLIFSCRNKDQGMVPPPQPQYQPPMYGQQPVWHSVQNGQPQQPYQVPMQPEPLVYQPPAQLPAEPWVQKEEQ